MHQTTRQIARETGIHHLPVYSIIHQDFKLKCLKKRRAQELTASVYISQSCRSCYKIEQEHTNCIVFFETQCSSSLIHKVATLLTL